MRLSQHKRLIMCALFKPSLEIFWLGLFEKLFFSTFGSDKYLLSKKLLEKVKKNIGGVII